MTSAAFTILWMKITVEWNSIIFCTLGATVGIVFGLEYVDGLLLSDTKKMMFVSIWFSFGMSLFLLNTHKKRTTYDSIQNMCFWKVILLLVVGFIGGM